MIASAGASIVVRVTTRAGRDAIDGWTDDGALKVRLAAAPSDGKANAALIKLLASALSVSPSRVAITRGAASRIKHVRVTAIDDERLRARLGGPART